MLCFGLKITATAFWGLGSVLLDGGGVLGFVYSDGLVMLDDTDRFSAHWVLELNCAKQRVYE